MEINAVKFRANCFKILDEVYKHNEVIITKRGKPIAKLVRFEQEEEKDPLLGALLGIGRTVGDLTQPITDPGDWEANK